MQDQRRRVSAVHPHWTAGLLLSDSDNSVLHEAHGSRGTYVLADGVLRVVWERFPPEDFIQVDDVFVHHSMVDQARRPKTGRPRPARSTRSRQARLPIHVVSLKRTPERRDRFTSLNAGIAFDFFDAVDGSTIDPATFFGSLAEPGTPYSAGAIGCALSHLALWEKSITEQTILTVVEDDSILRHDFEDKSLEVIGRLPADWDLIMWGWNFDSVLSILAMPGISQAVVLCDQTSLRQSIATFRNAPLDVHPYRLDKSLGTCGYSISPGGSRKFKERCFPLRNQGVQFAGLRNVIENNGIDIAMNRIYPTTNSYVCFPPLVVTPNLNGESLTLGPT